MPTPSAAAYAAAALALHDVDPADVAAEVARLAASMLPVDAVGLVRGRGRRLDAAAASGPLGEQGDLLQLELQEGPAVDAVARGGAHVADLATTASWPGWTPRARALGIGAVLAVPVRTRTRVVGALTAYAAGPDALDATAVATARVLAAHAAVAMADAEARLGLERAIDTRHVIGQAQGILMARLGVDAQGAFDALSRYSQDRNVRLRAVAEALVRDPGSVGDLLP